MACLCSRRVCVLLASGPRARSYRQFESLFARAAVDLPAAFSPPAPTCRSVASSATSSSSSSCTAAATSPLFFASAAGLAASARSYAPAAPAALAFDAALLLARAVGALHALLDACACTYTADLGALPCTNGSAAAAGEACRRTEARRASGGAGERYPDGVLDPPRARCAAFAVEALAGAGNGTNQTAWWCGPSAAAAATAAGAASGGSADRSPRWWPTAAAALRTLLRRVALAGATGAVRLDADGERAAPALVVVNWQRNAVDAGASAAAPAVVNAASLCLVALGESRNGSFVPFAPAAAGAASNAVGGGEAVTVAVFGGGRRSVPPDAARVEERRRRISPALYVAVSVCAGLGMALGLAFVVFTVRHRALRLIRMSSPNINAVSTAGAGLLYTSLLVLGQAHRR